MSRRRKPYSSSFEMQTDVEVVFKDGKGNERNPAEAKMCLESVSEAEIDRAMASVMCWNMLEWCVMEIFGPFIAKLVYVVILRLLMYREIQFLPIW